MTSAEAPPIRVVLADDHAAVRQALRLLLDAQPDLDVVGEAADGEEAVRAAVDLTPDVLVMDVSMPRMNGLQATGVVATRAPDVKVLALTRHSEASYVTELLRAGASGYALKQSSPAELIEAIRSVASGRPWLATQASHALATSHVRTRPAQPAPDLSPREAQILRLVAWGHSNKVIAAHCGLSVKTVEVHKANSMRKLGLESRYDIVRYALLRGWLHET